MIHVTKSELIFKVADQCRLPTSQTETVINTTLAVIRDELVYGGEVNLIGFGKFSVKYRAERVGQNPRTAEDIIIPAHKSPHFTAGKSLKQAVNND